MTRTNESARRQPGADTSENYVSKNTAPFPVPQPDRTAILDALAALFEPDDVIELRAFPKGKKRTDAGYFDGEHREALADAAVRLNAAGAAVYVTLNRIDPQLLGRYCNRIESFASATATDSNVIRRRWLLLDFDPVRPKDTSATDEQLKAAKHRARACYQFLKAAGWPEPLAGESGNGWHLLYPLDLPNNDESRDLVKSALAGLAAQSDDAVVMVDQAVFNAGRITKLFGTVATKGDHTPTAPWRLSRLVSAPERSAVVTESQLRALHPAKNTTEPNAGFASNSSRRADFNLLDFLARLGIAYEHDAHEGADRYKLEHCPFNPEHSKGEATILQQPGGRLGFKCQHDSCADKHWEDVRTLVDGPKKTRPGAATVHLINGANIEPEVIRWLWNGWLARGKLHIMAGAPGTGKTTIALAIAATISTGGRFPDGSYCEPGNVLIWSGEDDPKDTLLPRLLAMGADRKRIYFVSDAYVAGEAIPFDPAKHFRALTDAAVLIGGIKLMIVDPIVSAVAGDSHKAAEVRRSLQPVVDLASTLDAAMLGISHFSKGTAGNDPLERVTGSNAFGALPRVVIATAKVKDDESSGSVPRRIMVRTKSNIGVDGGGYNYSLEQTAVRGYPGMFASAVLWGDELEGTAKQLLASAETEADPDEQSQRISANDWLRELLDETNGMQAGEIIKLAKANGFSERTIYRVKDRLRLVVKTTGFGKNKTSTWRLPNPATPSNPATNSANSANSANLENGNIGKIDGEIDENAVIV